MEIGKKYKIVWKDNNYTKIISGVLIHDELHLITLADSKDNKEMIIGKTSIISIKEVEE